MRHIRETLRKISFVMSSDLATYVDHPRVAPVRGGISCADVMGSVVLTDRDLFAAHTHIILFLLFSLIFVETSNLSPFSSAIRIRHYPQSQHRLLAGQASLFVVLSILL